MKTTMQYSVGGELAQVPSNEVDEFNAVSKSQNITPEPIFTYRVSKKGSDTQQLDIPKAEYDEFAKTAQTSGYKIEPLRVMTMDDGTKKFLSARELRSFIRSDEYLNSTDGAEAKKRNEEMRAWMAKEEARQPGFMGELGRRMFTSDGIREAAEDSSWAKPYAYANDLANALVGGLLKGSAKISEGFGHIVGSDAIVDDARAGQEAVERNLPTDQLDTEGGGAVNRVLKVGKAVAEVSGEFAPSMVPGVGQAYAASLLGGGSTIRYMKVYDDAIANGVDPERAVGLASLGATVDAAQNLLLMGKFKGIWSGEQAKLAKAAKEGLVRRLTKDTLKTGAIMSVGGMAGDVVDQAAEGNYWLDVGRTAKVGFDQFIEGGLFHLINTGAHNATKINWSDEAKGIPAGAARDVMEAPQGRALVFSNSPDAARSIFKARRNGQDVSRKMIEELGLSGDTARTVADRNALGDRLMADYDAFKARVRTRMDDVQATALTEEIASRSEEGVRNPAFEKIWFKAVEQIKDARELDDPARRAAIVDEAEKVSETAGERLQRQKAVAQYNRERAAESVAVEVHAKTVPAEANGGEIAIDPHGMAVEAVAKPKMTISADLTPKTPAEAPKTEPAAPVEAVKPVEVQESAENPAPAKPVEAVLNKETPVAPSAPRAEIARPETTTVEEMSKRVSESVYKGTENDKDRMQSLTDWMNKNGKTFADFEGTPGRFDVTMAEDAMGKDIRLGKVKVIADKFRDRANDLIKRAGGKPTDEMREEGRKLVDEIAQGLSTESEQELYLLESAVNSSNTDKWMLAPIRKAHEIAYRERADRTIREADDYHERYEKEQAEFEKKRPALEKALADATAAQKAKSKELDDYKENFKGTIDELLKDDTRDRLATEWGDLLQKENSARSAIRPPETPRERNLREHKGDVSYVNGMLSYLKQLKKNAEKAGNPTTAHDADIAKYEGFLKSLKKDVDARVSVKAVPLTAEPKAEPPAEGKDTTTLAKLYDKYQKANGAYTPIEGKRTLSQIKAESRKIQDISYAQKALGEEYKRVYGEMIPDGWGSLSREKLLAGPKSKTAAQDVAVVPSRAIDENDPYKKSVDKPATAEKPIEAPAEKSQLDTYLADKKPMEAARIRKTLENRVNFGGDVGITTEAEIVDRAVKDGKSVITAYITESRNGKPKVVFMLGDKNVTATAANYAKARGVKVDDNSMARASERLTLDIAVKANEAVKKANGFSGGRIESYNSDTAIEKLLVGRLAKPLLPADTELAKTLRAVKDARVKRGDWNPEPIEAPKPEAAKPAEATAKPGKFTDDVYESYKSAKTYSEGAKAFAEKALDAAMERVEKKIDEAEKTGDPTGLKSNFKELEAIKDRINFVFEGNETKSEAHDVLRDIISEINAIEPIKGYEDIGSFVPRRGVELTGVKSVDRFNDKWDDENYSVKVDAATDGEIETKAREYFKEEIAFDKKLHDQLSDGDKRAFDKLVKELDDAKENVAFDDNNAVSSYIEAHEAVKRFAEQAEKMGRMMKDKDGRPVLFTDKGHATGMATDAASRVIKAISGKDAAVAQSAEASLRMAVDNGGEIPSKADVAEMAKELPEANRKQFTDYMDGWRKYAEGLKDKTSIADEASKLADDVDAAIEAEERAGASGKPDGSPVAAPRGSGTGALSQAEPMSVGPGTGKTSGIVTPQSFLKEAKKLFPDVAFRGKSTARMAKWAAGHFESASRIVRSRNQNAIRTVTHELGHDLEYLTRYDLARDPAVKRDLSDLGHQLYPVGPGMPKPPSYIGEGFAEYVRGYVSNDPSLGTAAPDLHAWFNGKFKASHPEIMKKLDRLRDMVQTMKEQDSAQEIRGFRHPATTIVERAWKHVNDVFTQENWNDSAATILKGMKKSGIDKLYHWQDEYRELEAAVKAGDVVRAQTLAKSVNDKIANHPYLFPTITRGTASQRVMDMARHGTTSLLGNRTTGESLKDIFSDFSHDEQESWKDYAIARQGLENYYAKGLEFGLPKEVLERVKAQHDSPKFQQALQRTTEYSHRILHLGVDSGLISQETYDKIVADHPIYVRITRRKADDMAGVKQGGSAINKRTGGFENILDPIDAMLMDQEKYLRACFQARSLQLIVNAAGRAKAANLKSAKDNGGPNTKVVNPADQSHIALGAYWPVEVPNAQEKVTFGAGKLEQGLTDAVTDYAARTGEDPIPLQEFVNDLATNKDAQGRVSQLSIFRDKPSQGKHNLVSVYIDGKLHTYELPDMKMANMLTDVYDKSDFNWIERGFGLATAGIRLGATTVNPGFAVRNGIRDSIHSAVMSESGALPMLGTLNGMLNQLTGKEAAQMFRMMGGHMSDLVGITKEQKWRHGGQVALAQNAWQSAQAYGAIDWMLMKPVIKATSDVLSVPELGPRVREFNGILEKTRAAGLDEDVCAMLAMSHAKDISIDFQRAGRFMKHINHFIPFSNAMWRGSEQAVRNLGALNALPHQFEDRRLERGGNTLVKGLSFITSWAAMLAMLEMSGDEKDRRATFERDPVEKWEYEHVGDWRIPLPFELGYIFGALPKAAIYEMHGDKGAMAECLKQFHKATPSKYLSPEISVGSISLFTPIIGLLKNEDYRGRAIVPEHIMQNRVKTDWHTQYTSELSKKLGGALGTSPAQLEYALDSYTGGLYRRMALAVENFGDTSRLKEGRGLSILDTLRARPQANRLVSDFYKFGEEAKQKLGSGVISLEEYGKFASMDAVKDELTASFNAMREVRASDIPLAEQDKRVNEAAGDVNEIIRRFNERDDYRTRGIAYAASHLTSSTPESLSAETREQYMAILKDVPKNEIVQAMMKFGNEFIKVKDRGVMVPQLRWSGKNLNERVNRLLLLLQAR